MRARDSKGQMPSKALFSCFFRGLGLWKRDFTGFRRQAGPGKPSRRGFGRGGKDGQTDLTNAACVGGGTRSGSLFRLQAGPFLRPPPVRWTCLPPAANREFDARSEEHTSELQ